MRTRRRGYLIAAIAPVAVLAGRAAWGHTPGVSASELQWEPDGRVVGRIVLSATEAAGTLPVTAARGAPLTEADLPALTPDFRAFLDEGLDVATDAANRCPGGFVRASLEGGDGLALETEHRCDPRAAQLWVTFFFLSKLGPDHRHLATVRGGEGALSQALLRGTRRSVSLARTPPPAAARREEEHAVARVVAAVSAALLAFGVLALWRWRRQHP